MARGRQNGGLDLSRVVGVLTSSLPVSCASIPHAPLAGFSSRWVGEPLRVLRGDWRCNLSGISPAGYQQPRSVSASIYMQDARDSAELVVLSPSPGLHLSLSLVFFPRSGCMLRHICLVHCFEEIRVFILLPQAL
jgi:hypothetical protein